MKKKYNIYGSGWTKKDAMNASKKNNNIEWVIDGSAESSFYPNGSLRLVTKDKHSKYKYGLLNESVAIDTESHLHIDRYLDHFDMIFTHNKEFYSKDDRIKFIPASTYWIENPKIYSKNKIVSMISSNKRFCEGHDIRLSWVKKLYKKLDLYGDGFNPIDKKEQGLNNYMFSVAIENASYETYFTEKILDCFATGTIPIYLGSPDIHEFFNADGIITLDKDFDISLLDENLYFSKIDAVIDNFNKVLKYKTVEDYIYKEYLSEVESNR